MAGFWIVMMPFIIAFLVAFVLLLIALCVLTGGLLIAIGITGMLAGKIYAAQTGKKTAKKAFHIVTAVIGGMIFAAPLISLVVLLLI